MCRLRQTPVLVEACKELAKKNEALELRLEAQEKMMAALLNDM